MENFIRKSPQEIKEIIMENNRTNEFREFTKELLLLQRAETDNLEAQHRTIYAKEEDICLRILELKEKMVTFAVG
jgi:hypothetical protein